MKLTTELHITLAVAAGIFTTSAIARSGGNRPSDFPRKVATMEEGLTCCTTNAKVAMTCTSCKTLDVKEGEKDKKGIMAWFAPDSTHDCSGCGGKITMKATSGGKGPTNSEYTHTCTKCGNKSAYVWTDHKKS